MRVKPIFKQNESPTIEEYLRRCGVEDPKEYINANWVESYKENRQIQSGVVRLQEAIESNKKIVLICDSDCDGYCATTIAYQFLVHHGVSTHDIIILFHDGKQHGLSKDILTQLNEVVAENDVSLLWIPDAGTNDVDACNYYAECYGIGILITDHHEFSRTDNDNVTVINNQAANQNVTNRNLCGTGVTHKVISAYCEQHNSKFHQSVIDLVALATIGDVMDMRNLENRTIVKRGLKHINNPFLRVM